MNGAGEKLLAGAGFAAQQHRGVGVRDDVDLLEHRADRRTRADDAKQRLLAMQGGASRRLLLQPAQIFHQPFAIAHDDVIEMQALANHRANHRQKARVFFARRVACGRDAFDDHHARDPVPHLDRRADHGDWPSSEATGHPADSGSLVASATMKGCRVTTRRAARLLGKLSKWACASPSPHPEAYRGSRAAGVVDDRDHAPLQVDEARQFGQDARQNRRELPRRRQDFRDFVKALQRIFPRGRHRLRRAIRIERRLIGNSVLMPFRHATPRSTCLKRQTIFNESSATKLLAGSGLGATAS